ncbi:Clp protease N-terminal domain-containing protein [Streptomyces sp. NPDC005805]|uniref:Clp protease N-terminal domain-containing protein n=1 Tax=Streptomyces sp. NPDC005805 TaxID=3157068 RepID=UPI0033D0F429
MHLPVPRPAHPSAPAPSGTARVPSGTDAALTDELAAVVAGARRRALRDADGQIDTAYLLHSLLESDAAVRAAVGEGPQLARLLGYLVQRSIGYGLRWRGSVEDSGALRAIGRAARTPGWSPSAASALTGAVARAGRRGETRAAGTDVLACLTADPDCRAAEVLRRAGIDAELLADRIASPSRHVSPG